MYMEEYNVRILSSARIDILDVVEHLNTLTPNEAVQYYDLLTERAEALRVSPERSPPVKDTQLRLRGYRTLPVNDYTALFVIKGDTVEIRRFLYSKRQYEWLL